ncbi:cysteine and histidine-rich domain-containing protein 1-like, partial [Stegodyphus dumicola]|uniref:cysteine and histidine-rich domain-containing protein 1-like n=1 Tax=Stegodyphus dumicola TaxID=202533 RepID=UPI0015AEE580
YEILFFIYSYFPTESCLHHPGVPVFHDVYKKWSCCEKKTTDFTEFLNIKGCTRSYHSNIKPVETPKRKEENDKEVYSSPKPMQQRDALERPDPNQPMVHLPFTIGASLKPVLDAMQKEITLEKDPENDSIIQLNTPCQNKGCKAVYRGEESDAETCLHHEGMPVFHEGMKYWSCCVKRTTDFDSFLEQIGCTTGKHKWLKDKNMEQRAKCRYDWHQTGNSVVISVYSKCPLPDLSFVDANPVKLHIYITFGEEKTVFDEELILYGVINLENCSVTYLGSKVEIKLKKAEPVGWKDLTLRDKIMDIDTMTIQDK